MNGKRTFLGLALVTGLAFSTACASGHSGSRSKNVRASSTTPSASASKRRQSEQQLVVITWCDTLNAGYRAQQKFTLDGSRVGSPVYFNVTPVDAMTSATQAGCMHSLSGAELRSVFTADYDTIVTTKTDNGSRHAGFEYSVGSVPETSDGGAADPTPNNFFDLTGIPADSLMKVLDTPGAVGPDKKVYFTREVDGETGSDATFQLMAADPNTPAKPVRALEEGGTVFFPPNATKPSISTTGDVSGHAVYVKGGAYGFEGTQDGLNFGTQSQLEAGRGTFYKVAGVDDILAPFHVYDGHHLLASTQEALYDLALSGHKIAAKKILSAPGHYLGDALLVGSTIMFVAGDDKGEQSLYTLPVTGGTEKRVYQFPANTTAGVNILGTADAS